MTIGERIREAATGPKPAPQYSCIFAAQWVGNSKKMKVLNFLGDEEVFFAADEHTQRTFLLLVAEALEEPNHG